MASLDEVVIISACRTPVGKFQGSLSDLGATQLGAIAVREAVKRAKLEPAQVDECIMGNVISAGLGQNPARQAAIFGGLSPEILDRSHACEKRILNQVLGYLGLPYSK